MLYTENLEKDILQAVDMEHQLKDYRPTVFIILENEKGEFLIFESPKVDKPGDPRTWSLPQGGVEKGSAPRDEVKRELREEAGIPDEEIEIEYLVGVESIDADVTRVDKRGFKKGKCYIAYKCRYTGKGNLDLDPKEVSQARWVTFDELKQYFDPNKEKSQFTFRMVERVRHARFNV